MHAALTFLGNTATVPFRNDLNVLTFADGGYDAPSTGYFVHEDTLAKDKDLLVRWLRATLKGLRYTLDNPDEVGKMLSESYVNVPAADAAAKWRLDAQFVDTTAVKDTGFGSHDTDSWRKLAQALITANQLPADFDVTKAYSNDVLSQISPDERKR